jgi:Ca2+-binding EF-hand superfamily protein
MLDTKEIESLRDIFLNIDKEGTGCVSANDLKKALSESDFHLPENEIESIVNEVDYHGRNKINYTEFLAATISIKKILTDEKLLAIFKQFDTDSTGKITSDNIIEAMHKLGHKIDAKDIKEIMEKHDINKDGYLSYDEFKLVFLGFDSK